MKYRLAGGLLFCLLLLSSGGVANASPDISYTLDPMHGYRMPIPLTYTVQHVIIDVGQPGLNKPSDLFIDKQGSLYIADTGNNRVVKLDESGKVLGIFGKEQGLKLNQPEGLFVDERGDIFVADTGNGRIVHLAPDGAQVEEFVKPESSLISPDTQFAPVKLVIDRRGYLYVLNRSDYAGFMVIDAMNRFRGYIGANRVPFSWVRLATKLLATPEQRDQLNKALPPQNANITLDDKGMIYSPTVLIDKDQIKKFNAVGENIFRTNVSYGENSIESGTLENPYFVDLAVNSYGIISALDATSRKIYQYDQEGNLLAVFGGHGEVKSRFEYPSSIAADGRGRLFVLDRDRNNIQVFQPTRFAELIQQASQLYYNGRYQEALVPWQEVLKINENYPLAHRGLAKVLMKEENWQAAMAEFKNGEDQGGYSQAFAEFRHDWVREHFGWFLLIAALTAFIIYWIVKGLHYAANSVMRRLGF